MPRRRLLLVAYYMPPAGGPAVQRILQFVRTLPAEGWDVEVLTVASGTYPSTDPDLLHELPPEVPIHRTRALDPYALYARLTGSSDVQEAVPSGSFDPGASSWIERLARWIRANVFLPDARIGWLPFAVTRGTQLLRSHRFDAMLTSGAPHSVHCTGRLLQQLHGVPWIADLHDPWTDIGFYDELPHTDWARRLDAALERSVLQHATRVTTVSPTWMHLFSNKGATVGAVVENGFEPSTFIEHTAPVRTDRFVVSHVGSLYANRNPTGVWDALAALHHDGAIPNLQLRLIGSVAPIVQASLQQRGLWTCTKVIPFVPHPTAVRNMTQSALLLLAIESFPAANGMITSKLYEYLAAGRPVLGVGPPAGDAAVLLRDHEAGAMHAPTDVDAIKTMIEAHYAAWEAGRPVSGADPRALRPHTRTVQGQRMAAVLNDAVSA